MAQEKDRDYVAELHSGPSELYRKATEAIIGRPMTQEEARRIVEARERGKQAFRDSKDRGDNPVVSAANWFAARFARFAKKPDDAKTK